MRALERTLAVPLLIRCIATPTRSSASTVNCSPYVRMAAADAHDKVEAKVTSRSRSRAVGSCTVPRSRINEIGVRAAHLASASKRWAQWLEWPQAWSILRGQWEVLGASGGYPYTAWCKAPAWSRPATTVYT